MPKIIDYTGRFAFFEEASFAIVRDHGIDRLSRHGLARVLGTSISTIRRLLSPDADLRQLALNEVGVRRRARLGRLGRRRSTAAIEGVELGVEAGVAQLAPLMASDRRAIAEELVWWRLAVAAPSTAAVVPDHEDDDGPLHHRFSIANHGFVSSDVLNREIERPRAAVDTDGELDPIVRARQEWHEEVAARLLDVVRVVVPDMEQQAAESAARVLHALVDGLSIHVCMGDLDVDAAVDVARSHLGTLR